MRVGNSCTESYNLLLQVLFRFFFFGFSPTYECTSSWPTTEDLQKKLKHELWLSRHLWAYVAQNLVLGYAIHPPVTAGHAPPYVVTGGITTSPPLLKLWLVWKLMTGGDKVIRWEDDSDGNRQWLAWLAAVLTVFSPAGRVRAVRADDFYTNLACVRAGKSGQIQWEECREGFASLTVTVGHKSHWPTDRLYLYA